MSQDLRTVTKKYLVRRQWLAFSVFILASAALIFSFIYVSRQSPIDRQPPILRRTLQWNEKLGAKLYSPNRKDPVVKPPPPGKQARVNGLIGLESEINLQAWRLSITAPSEGQQVEVLSLSLDDIKKLPRTEIVNEFKCIEGWSEVMSFAGVRFSDLLKAYGLGQRSPGGVHYSHVGLQTPDGEYYVSVDMRSMLNDQTLLAYEQNGEPLSIEHGAPLRLAIPTKYGVKNLKRIGTISFGDEPFPDYWGSAGYDWFLGL